MRHLSKTQVQRVLSVGRSLIAAQDPEEVLRLVLDAACDLTGARYAALGVLAESGDGFERFLFVGIDEERRSAIGPLPRGHGILGELIERPQPLRLRSIDQHPRSYGFPANHPSMETFLGVPIRIHQEIFGNLYLTEKEGGAEFSEEDERVLVVLAEWAAIAIDNARALVAARTRRVELERVLRGMETTASLNLEVSGDTPMPRVLELVAKRARAFVDARSCYYFAAGPNGSLRVTAVAGEAGRDVIGAEVEAGSRLEALLRGPSSVEVGQDTAGELNAMGIEAASGLLVRLRSRGREVGALGLFDRAGSDRPLGADDLLGIESFAFSAASVIADTRAIEDEKLRLSIQSSEAERKRWAREIHDETLQELGALKVTLETLDQAGEPTRGADQIAAAADQVERVIVSLQGLITELRPAALDQLGPGPALESLVERIRTRAGLDVELDIDLAYESGRSPSRHEPELEAAVYRVTQEALTNVVKHARANRARVLVEETDDQIVLVVEDDGGGFDPLSAGEGFGLVGMRERVALIDGDLAIESNAGGTRLRARFPVRRANGPGSAR